MKGVSEVDGERRNVKVILNEENYKIACDAHRDKKQVLVEGELDRTERIFTMIEVWTLQVLG